MEKGVESMRQPVIAGNWKMYKNMAETKQFLEALLPLVQEAVADIVVFPPAIDLHAASLVLSGQDKVQYGAQNVHWAQEGAYTGEISVGMLQEVGCKYVLCGHSERRQYFGETDDTVALRAKSALAGGLIPMICIGESLAERESGEALTVLANQLKGSTAQISLSDAGKIIIAYEPVWAIGTGKTASVADAQEAIGFIRGQLAKIFDQEIADSIRILYGGSVKPANIKELMAAEDIDGALVGGASLEPASFAAIINYQD